MPLRKVFSPDEANRLLPAVEAGLGRLQGVLDRMRSVRDQLADLRIIWEGKIEEPSCPDHDEYAAYLAEFRLLETQMRGQLEALHGLGCEVKDPDSGLVDFYAERNGTPVYLCWRRGEKTVGFWHTLEGGFSGRQPLTKF